MIYSSIINVLLFITKHSVDILLFAILVMLQPFDYKDPSENKRHKFLVQSVILKESIPDADIEPYVSEI